MHQLVEKRYFERKCAIQSEWLTDESNDSVDEFRVPFHELSSIQIITKQGHILVEKNAGQVQFKF